MSLEPVDAPSRGAARRPLATLAVACGGVFVVIASMTSLNTGIPQIGAQTGATQTELTWIVDGYTIALAALLLVGGALGDRWGRRITLHVSLVVFVIASAATLLTSDPYALISIRTVCGVAAAAVLPATLSMITATFPADKRTLGVAIWAMACALSGGLGLILSGVLLEFFDWRSTFLGPAAVGVLIIVIASLAAESRDDHPPAFDHIGGLLSAMAVGGAVLGVLEGPIHGWTSAASVAGLVVGLGAAAGFIVWELRCPQPLLDIRLFAVPRFAAGALSTVTQYLIVFALLFVVVQQLQSVLGYSPIGGGLILSIIAFALIPVAAVTAIIGRAIGMRMVTLLGMAFLIGGGIVLAQLRVTSGTEPLIVAILLVGAGLGFATPIATSAIVDSVSLEQQGVASAVNDCTRELGAAFGIALSGSLLASEYTRSITPNLAGLPPAAQRSAATNYDSAVATASRVGGADGQALLDAARQAFTDGVTHAFTGVVLVTVVLTVVLAFLTPGLRGRTWLSVMRHPAKPPSPQRAAAATDK